MRERKRPGTVDLTDNGWQLRNFIFLLPGEHSVSGVLEEPCHHWQPETLVLTSQVL